MKRIAPRCGGNRESGDGLDGLYEQIGLAVAEFLEARREGEFVTAEHYILRFPGHEEEARECFEALELLLQMVEPDNLPR